MNKRGEFFLVLAPMTVQLKLKGYDLIVFAVIHGFSQDDTNSFVGSAEVIAQKWLGDKSKARAVKDSIKTLAAAGYITVRKERRGKREVNGYVSNYDDLLKRLEAGEALPPLGRKHRGGSAGVTVGDSGTVPPTATVVPYHHDSGTVPPKSVVPYHHYKNNKNIVSYSFGRDARAEKEQQEELYKIFFWKGACAPEVEVQEFWLYNTKLDWTDAKGHKFNTWKQRVALADGWQFQKSGAGRADEKFLKHWFQLWMAATEAGEEIAPALMDLKAHAKKEGEVLYIYCTVPVIEWLQANVEQVHPFLSAIVREYEAKNLKYRDSGK